MTPFVCDWHFLSDLEEVLTGADPMSSLRGTAAHALGELAYQQRHERQVMTRIVPLVRSCLADPNPYVPMNAAYSIGRIGTRADLAALQPLLRDPDVATMSYTVDGEEKSREVCDVRERAREAIDKITARNASEQARRR